MSTSNVIMTQNMYNPSTGKMVYTLPSPTKFSHCEVGLLSSTYYNSFKNISAALGNNTITGSFPNATGGQVSWGTCTLADGFYSISDINNALWNYFVVNKYYMYNATTSQDVYFAQISVNPATYVVEVDTFLIPSAAQAATNGWTQPTGAAIVLSTSGTFYSGVLTISANLGTMLGTGGVSTTAWNSVTWTGSPGGSSTSGVPLVGTKAPALNPVTSVIVRCNLVCARIGNPTDMLCQVPLVSSYGAVDQYQASWPTFSNVVDAPYSTIELSFMDQNLNVLYFFDPELTFTLQIKHK